MPMASSKTALITGITGQDGSYLAVGLRYDLAPLRELLKTTIRSFLSYLIESRMLI